MPSTLQAFLAWAATTGGASALTYLIIELLDKYLPAGLTGNQKFYAAFALAISIPVAAYLGAVGLGYVVFSTDGLWASILVTLFLAQSVHRTTSLAAAATPALTTLESVAAPLTTVQGGGTWMPLGGYPMGSTSIRLGDPPGTVTTISSGPPVAPPPDPPAPEGT